MEKTEQPKNLMEGLLEQMKRVREELIPQYKKIGAPGAFGMAMLQADLDRADKAIISGDVIELLAAYKSLEESQ